MTNDNFYKALGDKLDCNAAKAKRVWEAWTVSAANDYPNDTYTSAVAHRRAAFQEDTGLPDGEVVRLTKLCAEFEKEQNTVKSADTRKA
jgi:hypothetical protein